MSYPNSSETSLESISIKLTESNLPSATLIKTSQQHISLTYTLSIDNISDEKIEIPELRESDNLMISIQSKKGNFENRSRYHKLISKENNHQPVTDKNVFKKKSIIKISNMDFSSMPQHDKNYESPILAKAKKTPIKANYSGIFSKTKSPKNDSMIQSRLHSNSKEIFMQDSTQNSGENVLMRTTRFYSLKNDKIMELKNGKSSSIRKQFQRNSHNFETQRKYNRLPIIKGSNFHSSAPGSMSEKRRVLSSQQNAQVSDRNGKNLSEKMILGKSCKMIENDEKAKKYLQKIIQNRSSVIHYSQHRPNKVWRDFKQNIQELI